MQQYHATASALNVCSELWAILKAYLFVKPFWSTPAFSNQLNATTSVGQDLPVNRLRIAFSVYYGNIQS